MTLPLLKVVDFGQGRRLQPQRARNLHRPHSGARPGTGARWRRNLAVAASDPSGAGVCGLMSVVGEETSRCATGRSRQVSTSLLDSIMALGTTILSVILSEYMMIGALPVRRGKPQQAVAAASVFADGLVAFGVFDHHWRKFCEEMSLDGLAEGARFAKARQEPTTGWSGKLSLGESGVFHVIRSPMTVGDEAPALTAAQRCCNTPLESSAATSAFAADHVEALLRENVVLGGRRAPRRGTS